MEGEADEELVSGGEGGSLVHGTLLLTSDDRALLFSPDLDLKAKDRLDFHLCHTWCDPNFWLSKKCLKIRI